MFRDLSPVFEKVKGKHIIFAQNDKIIKEGILVDFSLKSLNLRFDILSEDGETIKSVEVPYPFNILKENRTLVFDYRISNLKKLVKAESIKSFIQENNKVPSRYFNSLVKISVKATSK